MAEITDPSTELYRLCKKLSGVDAKDQTRKTLARQFDLPVDSPEFFAVLAALSGRIMRLRTLVASLTATPEPFRTTFDDACNQVSTFVSSANLHNPWSGVRDSAFTLVALNTLLMAGHTVRGAAPLSVPTDAERAELIVKIDEAINAMRDRHDVFVTLLVTSFTTLRLMIDKMEFYGVDGVFEHLLSTHAILKNAESSQSNNSNRVWSYKAWNALATIYVALTIPDAGITAVQNYYTYSQAALQYYYHEVPEPDLKLITGPTDDAKRETPADEGVGTSTTEVPATDGRGLDAK